MDTSLRTAGHRTFRAVDSFSGRVYVHRPGKRINCGAAEELLKGNYLIPLPLEGKGGMLERLVNSAVLRADLKGFTFPVGGAAPESGTMCIMGNGKLIAFGSARGEKAFGGERLVYVTTDVNNAAGLLLLTVLGDRDAALFRCRYKLVCGADSNLEAVTAVVGIRDDESNTHSKLAYPLRL